MLFSKIFFACSNDWNNVIIEEKMLMKSELTNERNTKTMEESGCNNSISFVKFVLAPIKLIFRSFTNYKGVFVRKSLGNFEQILLDYVK